MEVEFVSGRELARRLGISEAAVRKHVERGLYAPKRSGEFDFEACKAAWLSTRDPEAVHKGQLGGAAVRKEPLPEVPGEQAPAVHGESNLAKARTAITAIKAQRAKLDLDRAKGTLISKADALKACLAIATIVNERIDGAAAQIGPRVVGLDAAGAERVAREILDNVRREIHQMGAAIETLATDTA